MRSLWIMAAVLLSACSSKPDTFAPKSFGESLPDNWQTQWQSTSLKETTNTHLLSLVSSAELNRFIEHALENNPAIQQQLLALAESEVLNQQIRAERLPQLDFKATAQRQKTAAIENDYGLNLSSSWELDVWGRIADKVQAGDLTVSAQSHEFTFARRSLAANVIKAWLTLVNSKRLLVNEQQKLASFKLTESIIKQRYVSGLGQLQDLDATKAQSAQLQASVAQLQQDVVVATKVINQLLGQTQLDEALPDNFDAIGFPKLSIPSQALGNRPDLQAAYLNILAADKQSQVAYKNLLPQFNLTFDLSRAAQSSSDLLSADPLWLLLGSVSQPIFNHGALKRDVEAAQFRAEQALWAYKESLLAAYLEVESGVKQEQSLSIQYTALSHAHQYAKTSEQYVTQRYRQGLDNIQTLLSAKQTTFDTYSQLLQVSLSRAVNRIDLGLALGLPIYSERQQGK